ncbi:DUF6089 family protein [Bacteroidota bacterium]
MLILLIIVIPQFASGQRKSDIGLIGGASYYMGDVNHSRHFYSPSPAGGLIYRYNFNPRNSLRFNVIYAMLKGDPADFNEPFPGYPADQVEMSDIVDVGLSTEFNFKTYKATNLRRYRYTPYVSGGIGFTILTNGGYTTALNFAGGFKYNVTTRMSAGFEWSFRKTFSDELDNVQNIGYENNVFFHNKDWYSIVGVFVTYKIFDWGIDCPAYE